MLEQAPYSDHTLQQRERERKRKRGEGEEKERRGREGGERRERDTFVNQTELQYLLKKIFD